eukprot:3249309-Rhodomonas_salina.1
MRRRMGTIERKRVTCASRRGGVASRLCSCTALSSSQPAAPRPCSTTLSHFSSPLGCCQPACSEQPQAKGGRNR